MHSALNSPDSRKHLIAIYPGSFDPITLGHLDIIQRATHICDRVVVAVLKNPAKTPLFTVPERLALIQSAIADYANVETDSFTGLTVNYAKLRGGKILIRGLRAVSDFELELQMAHTNKTLAPDIETLFLTTATEYSFLSSSVVKQIAQFGGAVDHLVPPHVAIALQKKFST
jgi:pantetheine-phosphate adenylyltransferase